MESILSPRKKISDETNKGKQRKDLLKTEYKERTFKENNYLRIEIGRHINSKEKKYQIKRKRKTKKRPLKNKSFIY